MIEISKLIAEIKAEGILRAGNKLEQLYSLAEQMETDCAELQQKLDAMAAENAALKSSIPSLKDVDLDNDNMDDVSLAEDVGFNDAVTLMNRWKGDTPATDAYLNSVRAEGIEMLADNLATPNPELADGTNAINKAVSWYARHFANRLRSGTHDNADKAG